MIERKTVKLEVLERELSFELAYTSMRGWFSTSTKLWQGANIGNHWSLRLEVCAYDQQVTKPTPLGADSQRMISIRAKLCCGTSVIIEEVQECNAFQLSEIRETAKAVGEGLDERICNIFEDLYKHV